ncbi:WD repeat domain-containing protein 83 [Phycodurus eques]|uniref:WD repeat domain-containing protein 83 n=1 Tax=Phycodurus eques TaxID=693459 RepID=UPI002ACEAACB|nr:WD repeat domain-containing protein 83 [Phycodurus eques]XP_061535093.1 WD repeat domain-containing protein 83 [Phycodurus eques]XP_061535094.1 WD repeat domain-containing protein 83 [Phycodurus eques]
MSFPLPKPQTPQLPQHLLRTIDCQQGAVRAVRFNVDGQYLLSCGGDKSLKLWSGSRGTLLKTYSGHGYEVLDADGSFDNSNICSCSSDKTVILWDVATGQVARKLRGHAGKVNCVQFNEEATVILSGSLDGTVRCWDTRSRKNEPIQVLDEARDSVSSLKVSKHEVLTGSVDGQVRRYDLRMGQLHVDFLNSPITCVCFSQDGQCTLSSSLDSTVRLLDKSTGEMLGEYTGHTMKGYKLECCLSSKDTHVLSCSEDGHVYFWDLVEGCLSMKLPVGKAVVQSLSFHPTQTRLLTASEGRVQVWAAELEDPDENDNDNVTMAT